MEPKRIAEFFAAFREAVAGRDDDAFDSIYPPEIRAHSERHWTPVGIARRAAFFLAPRPGVRVLDIGCGPGKFCMIGATVTAGHFTGVEQREALVAAARQAVEEAKVPNVEIIHANIVEIEFSGFDAFYLYNPFAENLVVEDRIDSSVVLSKSAHRRYDEHVNSQLALAPVGTRVATYWGEFQGEAMGFELKNYEALDLLKLWEKRK